MAIPVPPCPLTSGNPSFQLPGIPRKLQISLIILYRQGFPGLPAEGTNAIPRVSTVCLSQTQLPSPCSSLKTTLPHSSHSVNLFRKCHSARKRVKPQGEWIGVTVVPLPVHPARFLSRSPTHSEQAAWPPCPDCPPGLPVSCLPGGDLQIPISLFQIKRCFNIKGCCQSGSLS